MPFARRIAGLLGLTALALFAPAHVEAQIRYEFTAFSSFPLGGATISGSWSAVLAGFAADGTILEASDLESCEALSSITGPLNCGPQTFQPFEYSGDVIGFGVDLGGSISYVFEADAFTEIGTHFTTEFGSEQAGRLVVSRVAASVPEPSSAVLLLSAVVGGVLVRRRLVVS
jgi:hypothetical protein